MRQAALPTFPSRKSDCIDLIKHLLSYLPQNNMEDPPFIQPTDDPTRIEHALQDIVQDDPRSPYDMKDIIHLVVDDGEFLEVQPLWGQSIVVGFARLNGHVIGIVGNQPQVVAGTLDIEAAEKAARFVRTCDAFNIPIVTFVDVPGFLPGTDQEYGGIIRHGAKLLYAYCEATVPRVQVITRKGYGGAYVVMDSKSIGSDLAFAAGGPRTNLAARAMAVALRKGFRRLFDRVSVDRASFASALADLPEDAHPVLVPNHRSVVDVRAVAADGTTVNVAGALSGPQQVEKIVQINGRNLDLRAEGVNLIINYDDQPGALGKIGTVLGSEGVNILAAQLSQDADGDGATIMLRLDRVVPEDVLAAIRRDVNAMTLEVVDLS